MATETRNILNHKPMTQSENNVLWAMLIALALAVIGFAIYQSYAGDSVNTEYETSTVMGNTERAPTNTTVTR